MSGNVVMSRTREEWKASLEREARGNPDLYQDGAWREEYAECCRGYEAAQHTSQA